MLLQDLMCELHKLVEKQPCLLNSKVYFGSHPNDDWINSINNVIRYYEHKDQDGCSEFISHPISNNDTQIVLLTLSP